jgi:2-oxoglutarate/2-oxoacid ferredoxin oxidoreductase subunit beta
MSSEDLFDNTVEIQWCPGCPNFKILQAYKKAFEKMGKKPHEICLVSGIGQAAKLPHYLNCNFFNGLHGRALPVAQGIYAVNPEMTIIVATGDGDCYGEGGNHFMHAMLRNPDITVVVHNNEVYALTKGQASPTTPMGQKTLQVKGVEKNAANPVALAIISSCTFVARGYAMEVDHLADLIVEGVSHKGFAFIDVVQPCITWGTLPISEYKDRIYKTDSSYDPSDREAALENALSTSEKIPIGILYRAEPSGIFAGRFHKKHPMPLSGSSFPGADKIKALL